MLAFFLTVLAR